MHVRLIVAYAHAVRVATCVNKVCGRTKDAFRINDKQASAASDGSSTLWFGG